MWLSGLWKLTKWSMAQETAQIILLEHVHQTGRQVRQKSVTLKESKAYKFDTVK
jgi:activator of HSP90 ATPase